MTEINSELYKSSPERLARVLNLALPAVGVWNVNELRAIFQYQLSQTMPSDTAKIQIKTPATSPGQVAGTQVLHSFGALLRDAHPPLGLLKLIKDFAKTSHQSPEYDLPEQVSLALYYLSIASALVRCNSRISSLNNLQLQKGFSRLAAEPWMEDDFRELLLQATAFCRD